MANTITTHFTWNGFAYAATALSNPDLPNDLKHSIQERIDAGETVDMNLEREKHENDNNIRWMNKNRRDVLYGITSA